MKISGFTIVRNAGKYYFPVKESILSILPIVDEFIVALGDCDADDDTLARIESIGSDKIRILHRSWNEQLFEEGRIFAEETNFALSQCSGDWCFYLQADEVVHERDLDIITQACEQYQTDERVDGLLFHYYHFWGDYDHYLPFHGWYPREIRIVRNRAGIQSYKDAQSFRKHGEKLTVADIGAHIYHYGYVRPPEVMNAKKKEQDGMHIGKQGAERQYGNKRLPFDFGDMSRIPLFDGDHPVVMRERIGELHWADHLAGRTDAALAPRPRFKHEKWHYRLLSRFERNFGREIFSFKNYKLLS